jgi:hypothetical protein
MAVATVSEFVEAQPDGVRELCAELASVIDGALERAEGAIWHGHPVWLIGKTPVAGFKPAARFVTFMIWRGQDIDAPLTKTGSFRMGVVKPASVSDVDRDAYTAWLRAAEALEP